MKQAVCKPPDDFAIDFPVPG